MWFWLLPRLSYSSANTFSNFSLNSLASSADLNCFLKTPSSFKIIKDGNLQWLFPIFSQVWVVLLHFGLFSFGRWSETSASLCCCWFVWGCSPRESEIPWKGFVLRCFCEGKPKSWVVLNGKSKWLPEDKKNGLSSFFQSLNWGESLWQWRIIVESEVIHFFLLFSKRMMKHPSPQWKKTKKHNIT